MHHQSQILFLENQQIEKGLYDQCIDASPHGLIYAKSFFLDHMSSGWGVLAAKNYDWVMPVTRRKEWGINYLYQPAFTQQSGVFAKPNISIPAKEIIKCLQRCASFWEISWRYGTAREMLAPFSQITIAANFILNLSADYASISRNYHTVLKNNLKFSRRFNHVYRETKDCNKCVELYKEYYSSRLPKMKLMDYENFKKLCNHLQGKNEVICREIVSGSGEVLASALLLKDNFRIYNIINTTTQTGRKTMANHCLLDKIIGEFSSKELLFDFEGSDLPGVRLFYESFGATNQPFVRIKYNNLAWPLKMFKK